MAPKAPEQPSQATEEDIRYVLDSVRDQFADLVDQMKKVSESSQDAAASIRMELQKSRAESLEIKAHLHRLQGRVDTQLMTLVIANLASGVGVAALMLGAARAF